MTYRYYVGDTDIYYLIQRVSEKRNSWEYYNTLECGYAPWRSYGDFIAAHSFSKFTRIPDTVVIMLGAPL